ncbi:MAG: GNAT family N-acetyltransferase [Alphaproteobacteria bacterium]|nr:GNAT family N-acetyltransferase [Alphaproteobacteria bacterium]
MHMHMPPQMPFSGCLDVRLARGPAEIAAAQALRHRVFVHELGATPSPETARTGLDVDPWDDHCEHLLALADGVVVGTYRLIGRGAAERVGGFYSAAEFDIGPLLREPGEILELGRSCIDRDWRNRGTLQLLWQGLADIIIRRRIGILFGCASLPGTDPHALAPQLAYLHDHHLAPLPLRARALPHRAAPMRRPDEGYDPRQVAHSLPPLLKGYLNAGAGIGTGAVVDHEFNTTDVLVVLKTETMTARYQRRYETKAA